MSLKFAFSTVLAAVLGVTLLAAPAAARDRYYDFDQAWGDSVRRHQRDEALSAPTVDVMRQRPNEVFNPYMTPHDPRGIIILEGAR